MAATAAMPVCPLASAWSSKVRNTFIDVPLSVSPMPSPLASAPARCAVPLKESLAAAVKEPWPPSPAGEETPTIEVGSPASEECRGGKSRRRPGNLNLESIAKPAVATDGSDSTQSPTHDAGSPQSISPFPEANFLPTPTGTPSDLTRFRPKLSLVDMIESPSVDAQGQMDVSWQQTWFQPMYQEYCMMAPVAPEALSGEVALVCLPVQAAPVMPLTSPEPPPAPQAPPQFPETPEEQREPPAPALPPSFLEAQRAPPAPAQPPQLPQEVEEACRELAPPPASPPLEPPANAATPATAAGTSGEATPEEPGVGSGSQAAPKQPRTWAQRLVSSEPPKPRPAQ